MAPPKMPTYQYPEPVPDTVYGKKLLCRCEKLKTLTWSDYPGEPSVITRVLMKGMPEDSESGKGDVITEGELEPYCLKMLAGDMSHSAGGL